ncbi:hypothetical protein [Burkholderia pyrrocinia]|uniref:hypothetical protein n=1 Tax=Burkholderia pyrrocinia TaxID=60550 RepID=UPI001F36F852|nr:hypothetical protein [Burkholderia pyrrocinia]
MQIGFGHEESGEYGHPEYGQPAKGRWRAAGIGASLAAGGPAWHAKPQFYLLAGRVARAARNAGRPADAGRRSPAARTGANIKLVLRLRRPIHMPSDIPPARGFIESMFGIKIARTSFQRQTGRARSAPCGRRTIWNCA